MTLIEEEIARREPAPLAEVKERWRMLRRGDPPETLPPTLMRGALAYGLQAERFGGLSGAAKAKLARIAKRLEKDPASEVLKGEAPPPGARLVREWGGERHQVEILKDGFAYRGDVYKSLSEIARAITSAHWSGPRFFGLQNRRKNDDR